MFQMARSRTIPALLTTMSSRPQAARALSTMVGHRLLVADVAVVGARPPRRARLMMSTTRSASRPRPSPLTELPGR